jgi:uncharacterized protein
MQALAEAERMIPVAAPKGPIHRRGALHGHTRLHWRPDLKRSERMRTQALAGAFAALLLWALIGAADGGAQAIGTLVERAEAGDSAAQFELAARHSRGEGVAADPDAAGRWLVRAAEGGHVEARAALGMGLLERASTPAETAAAIEWLTAAAGAGHLAARMLLGQTALEAGRGEEAVRHFRIAAENGDARLQVGLGLVLIDGEALPADPLEALHWFRLAALQGHAGGQRGLGALLANGAAGPADPEAGYFWLRLAAGEDSVAAGYADELARDMDAAQREAIQVMTRAWTPGESGPALRSVAGHVDLTVFLLDAIEVGEDPVAAPRSEQRWILTAAAATRRAPGYYQGADAVIELLLLSNELPAPALWRWLNEGGPTPQHGSLQLFFDIEGRLLGGMLRTTEGFVEVPASSIESDLRLRHGRLGGSLRRKQGDAGWPFNALDVRVLVDVQGG